MTHTQIETTARAIIDDILADLRDRRGLRQTWESIDDDIRAEIVSAWHLIAEARLLRENGSEP